MTLSAESLRTLVISEIERRDTTPAFVASQVPRDDGTKGIHRNAAYQALKADGDTRVGTLVGMAKALGYTVEETYTLRNLGACKRRRLHDEIETVD